MFVRHAAFTSRLAPALLLGLTLSTLALRAEEAPPLFREHFTGGVAPRCIPGVGDKRIRTAPLNASVLPVRSRDGGIRIKLNLFEDAVYTALISSVKTVDTGRTVYSGTVEGVADSNVTLAVDGAAMAGMVEMPGKAIFSISYHGEGQQIIAEIDRSQFPAPRAIHYKTLDTSSRAVAPRASSVIDVMVVYTAAALAGAGGLSGINSVIDLAVADANTVFTNSQINASLNLVYRGQIAYTETGKSETELVRLQEKNDGFMDDVHTLRDQFGADVVCLLTDSLSDACGIAFVMTNPGPGFEDAAFSVVDRTCVKNHTYIHELGHNLGCAHDKANSGGPGAFPYSFGTHFIADGTRYGTVMSYPGEKVPYFSNPNLSFRGVPMGVADQTDNSRTINNTASILAAFRATKGGSNAAPTVSLTAPRNNASFPAPASVELTATAADSDGAISKVEFFRSTVKLGEVTAPPYTMTLSNVPAGNYRYTAAATDSGGATTVSAAVEVTVTTPAGPLNDAFANRIAILGIPSGISGTNVDATKETGEPKHAGVDGGRSVWWSWTAPASGSVVITAAGDTFEPTLAVYTGASVTTLTEVGGDNGQLISTAPRARTVMFKATKDISYAIAVDAQSGATGKIVVQALSQDGARPSNDDFSGRFLLSGGSATAFGSTLNASGETGEPSHAGSSPKSSIWWTWIAPANGLVTLSTAGSNFDTVLAVYSGTAVNALTRITSNDDETSNSLSSKVQFLATNGTTYQIAVDGFLVAEGGGRDVQLNLAQSGPNPGNDAFADRIFLQGFGSITSGSNVGATSETGEPQHFNNANGNSVWWSWTAPASGSATIDTTGSSYDTIVAVYTGNLVAALTLIGQNDDETAETVSSLLTFNAVSGTTYQIALDGTGLSTAFGNIRLKIALAPAAAPVNDHFANAFLMTGIAVVAYSFNSGGTLETGEPRHAQVDGGKSVWWKWTAPAAGQVTIRTEGSTFDSVLGVYTGTVLNALTEATSNDDASTTTYTSSVRFAATSGTVYYIAVDGYKGASGAIVLSLELSNPPTVTLTASDANAAEAAQDPATFTISRTGATSSPLTVKFSFGGSAINGSDFTALPLSATLLAGSASATVNLAVIDDTFTEGAELLEITLREDAAYILGAQSSAAATLADDDGLPTLTLAATDATAAIGDNGMLTITRTGSAARQLVLKLAFGGSAVNGTDYATLAETVTLAAGALSATVDIAPLADAPFKGIIAADIGVTSGSFFILGNPSVDRVTMGQTLSFTSAPVATPNPAKKNETVTFIAGSNAADATFSWDFGDGSTSNGASVTHRYTTSNMYTVTVTATHARSGMTAQTTVQIAVGGFNGVTPGTTVPVFISKRQLKLSFSNSNDQLNVTFTYIKDFLIFDKVAFATATNSKVVKMLVGATQIDTATFQTGKADGRGTFRWYNKKGEIRYAVRGEKLSTLLAPFGAVDDNVLVATSVIIPLTLSIEGVNYSGDAHFSYRAKKGKTGTGK